MNEQQSSVTVQLVRYGLPLVVLIFYVTASRWFDYTPDSTFLALHYARNVIYVGEFKEHLLNVTNGTPQPLWLMMLGIGTLLHLDLVLVAKVMSLFFSCCVILCAYLLALEVMEGRLIGFCTALAVGMQAWLLHAAPTGSALPLGVMLSIASLFFLLRNEYVLATLSAGLCTMVFWQAAGLMVFILVDIGINSVNKRRGMKVIVSAVLVYVCTLLPWFLSRGWFDLPLLPVLIPVVDWSAFDALTVVAIALQVALMCSGIMLFARLGSQGWSTLRGHITPFLWIIWLVALGIFGTPDLVWIAFPLVTVYAFLGLKEILQHVQRPNLLNILPFILTGLLLIQSQITFGSVQRPYMVSAIDDSNELAVIGYWLKVHAGADALIASERRGTVAFYAAKPVMVYVHGTSPHSDFVVSSKREIQGYTMVYAPDDNAGMLSGTSGEHFAVWKRN